jgi:hypothetical protein
MAVLAVEVAVVAVAMTVVVVVVVVRMFVGVRLVALTWSVGVAHEAASIGSA